MISVTQKLQKLSEALEIAAAWMTAANEHIDKLYAKVAELEKKLNERK